MSRHEEHLERWREAGLLDAAQVERIAAFERGSNAAAEDSGQRPGLVEALLYLGIIVVASGVIALVTQNWSELRTGARIASLVVPAALALGGGFAMRASGRPQLVRGGNIAWLAATALIAGVAAVAGDEADAGDRAVFLQAGIAAVAVALVLWVLAVSHPQVFGLAAGLFVFAESLGAWPDDYSPEIAGVLMFAFGLLGLAATELRLLQPRASAAALFAILAAAGPFHAGILEEVLWAELLTFVAGGGLIALSLWRSTFIYLLAGVTITFVALITFIFEYFENEIGAPVALMLSGVILVAGVLLVLQARGLVRREVPA